MLNSAAKIINVNEMNSATPENNNKIYDYTLKFLLIGDSDVGKEEIFEFIDRSNQIYQINSNADYHQTSPVSSPVTSGKF